jgi:hypothetical protein
MNALSSQILKVHAKVKKGPLQSENSKRLGIHEAE